MAKMHTRLSARCVHAHGRPRVAPQPRPSPCASCARPCSADHTALREASNGECRRGLSRTSEPARPGSAHARGALGVPRRAAGGSHSGPSSRSDPIRTVPTETHTRMPPAALVRAQSSCAHRCIPHGQLSDHTAHQAERSAHRPAGAALGCSHVRGPGRALALGIRWGRGHFCVRTADWYR